MVDLPAAVSAGDRVAALESLRDHLALTIMDSPPAAVAGLAKQLREVIADLSKLAPKQEGTALDELLERRRARRQSAATG